MRALSLVFLFLLFVFASESGHAACSGCCSGHNGVNTNMCQSNGKVVCNDGATSSSCLCSECGSVSPPTPTPTCTGGRVSIAGQCVCQNGQIWAELAGQCHTPAIPTACGVERWLIKTASDPAAGQINQTPVVTSIESLTSLTVPSTLTATIPTRFSPTELTTYVLEGTLTDYRMTEDSDYHLVIKDSAGNSMIVEIAHQDCISASSPFRSIMINARKLIDQAIINGTAFKTTSIPVRVTGVGFWDTIHGQRGVAANGIELHPITNIEFNPISVLPSPATITVTEFFASTLNHYFITANADESAALANNASSGWKPTGTTFKAFRRDAFPANADPVCRFYGDYVIGPNSHFYTADPGECNFLKSLAKPKPYTLPQWNYEELAFGIKRPTNTVCAAGTTAVYRAYNKRAAQNDSNHRYMTSRSLYDQMVSQGWAGEGVVMCAEN